MYTHLNRSAYLTGVLSPPVIVNGSNLLITQSYSVQMHQDINMDNTYLQGGPGKAIGDFKGKNIQGDISAYLRYDEASGLEDAVIDLINAAQNYDAYVSLTTFMLPYNSGITAETFPYVYTTNSLVFDTCVVESFTISVKSEGYVELDFKIMGQNDTDNNVPINLPNDVQEVYRRLTWYDCSFSKSDSALENLMEFRLTIKKELYQPYFLIGSCTPDRYDRPNSTGVKSVLVEFEMVEAITTGFDLYNYVMGGYQDSGNLAGNFGPISFNITNILFNISVIQLSPELLVKKTSGFFRLNPLDPTVHNFLLTIA